MRHPVLACTKCGHLTSRHTMTIVTSSDLQKGPYRCQECVCERPQDGPGLDRPLSRAEYDAWQARR